VYHACVCVCVLITPQFDRVLYIDIDVHHGDGVEEAFYTSDRVMTLSFHKHGDFFPGTGALEDCGEGRGMDYSLNFPMDSGIGDEKYVGLYKEIVTAVMDRYKPSAVVLQCGADSLAGDRLGIFNLSSEGHAECVRFTESFELPLLVLGGGGYTPGNVARCWAYETATLLHRQVSNEIPYNEFYSCYDKCDYGLVVRASTAIGDKNQDEDLKVARVALLERLKGLPAAPSVQYSLEVPRDELQLEERANERRDASDPDMRVTQEDQDRRVSNPNEFYDNDD
jgi:histone deacetylase 1/2